MLALINSLLKQNMKSCNAKETVMTTRKVKKINNNRSKKPQKTTLHVLHTFLVHFFAVVLHYYNVILLTFFFRCRSFSPWWPLAFLIFSLPL